MEAQAIDTCTKTALLGVNMDILYPIQGVQVKLVVPSFSGSNEQVRITLQNGLEILSFTSLSQGASITLNSGSTVSLDYFYENFVNGQILIEFRKYTTLGGANLSSFKPVTILNDGPYRTSIMSALFCVGFMTTDTAIQSSEIPVTKNSGAPGSDKCTFKFQIIMNTTSPMPNPVVRAWLRIHAFEPYQSSGTKTLLNASVSGINVIQNYELEERPQSIPFDFNGVYEKSLSEISPSSLVITTTQVVDGFSQPGVFSTTSAGSLFCQSLTHSNIHDDALIASHPQLMLFNGAYSDTKILQYSIETISHILYPNPLIQYTDTTQGYLKFQMRCTVQATAETCIMAATLKGYSTYTGEAQRFLLRPNMVLNSDNVYSLWSDGNGLNDKFAADDSSISKLKATVAVINFTQIDHGGIEREQHWIQGQTFQIFDYSIDTAKLNPNIWIDTQTAIVSPFQTNKSTVHLLFQVKYVSYSPSAIIEEEGDFYVKQEKAAEDGEILAKGRILQAKPRGAVKKEEDYSNPQTLSHRIQESVGRLYNEFGPFNAESIEKIIGSSSLNQEISFQLRSIVADVAGTNFEFENKHIQNILDGLARGDFHKGLDLRKITNVDKQKVKQLLGDTLILLGESQQRKDYGILGKYLTGQIDPLAAVKLGLDYYADETYQAKDDYNSRNTLEIAAGAASNIIQMAYPDLNNEVIDVINSLQYPFLGYKYFKNIANSYQHALINDRHKYANSVDARFAARNVPNRYSQIQRLPAPSIIAAAPDPPAFDPPAPDPPAPDPPAFDPPAPDPPAFDPPAPDPPAPYPIALIPSSPPSDFGLEPVPQQNSVSEKAKWYALKAANTLSGMMVAGVYYVITSKASQMITYPTSMFTPTPGFFDNGFVQATIAGVATSTVIDLLQQKTKDSSNTQPPEISMTEPDFEKPTKQEKEGEDYSEEVELKKYNALKGFGGGPGVLSVEFNQIKVTPMAYSAMYYGLVEGLMTNTHPEYKQYLVYPQESRTFQGRALINLATSEFIRKAIQKANWMNPMELYLARNAISQYLQYAEYQCQQDRNAHGQIQYHILKSIIAPHSTQEYQMNETVQKYYNPNKIYDLKQSIYAFGMRERELDVIINDPQVVTEFTEKITHGQSTGVAPAGLGQFVIQERYPIQYKPQTQPVIREMMTQRPLFKRKRIYKERQSMRPISELNIIEQRTNEQLGENRPLLFKRMRFN